MSRKEEDASRRRVNLRVHPFDLFTGETDPCGTGAHPPRPEGRGFPLILLIAENRPARYHYEIGQDLEAGVVLTGSEVKSLRTGQTNITEAYVAVEGGELWIVNAHIAALGDAGAFGHAERRRRKLLVSRRELSRLWSATARDGMTIVPLRLYFNEKGRVKLLIATARGKKKTDKREREAKRDWGREKARLLKQAG